MKAVARKLLVPMVLLLCSFLYTLIAMVASREIAIPAFIPQSVDGNIPGDPTYYRDLARVQARNIAENGLAAFQMHPSGQGPAGIASLFLLFTESIYPVVFLNAALHAISCTFLFLLSRNFFPKVHRSLPHFLY